MVSEDEARELYEENLEPFRKFIHQEAMVKLAGEEEDISIFDWFELIEDAEEASPVDEEEDEVDVTARADQIRENYLDEAARERVEALEWVPFAMVGVSGGAWAEEGFDEGVARGVLVFDVGNSEGSVCPVVSLFPDDDYEADVIAEDPAELTVWMEGEHFEDEEEDLIEGDDDDDDQFDEEEGFHEEEP